MVSDELARQGRILEGRRLRLRALLQNKHEVSFNLVDVRLWHCYIETERLRGMAKKEQKKVSEKAEFVGFFNLELTEELKVDCKIFMQDESAVGLEIEQAIASGYKLGLSKDGRTDGYQATMQQMVVGYPNAGYCMSAFAKHWYSALGVLMFKHAIILKYDWKAKIPVSAPDDIG